MRINILVICLIFCVYSCACSCVTDKSLVISERAVYNAVAPEYLELIEKEDLSPEDKARRKRTIELWNKKLLEAESTEMGG